MKKVIEEQMDDAQKGQEKMKSRLLFLQSYFQKYTDENHQKTMKDLMEVLTAEGFKADKRTVKQDVLSLNQSGMEIVSQKDGNVYHYYFSGGVFEIAEIKLLIDTIQSSILISKKKSEELIDKLGTLVSENQLEELKCQIYFVNRKNLCCNEQVYYAIDAIYQAINEKKNITFCYRDWTVQNNKFVASNHKDGYKYRVSPLALFYNDNKYYVVGYDIEAEILKNFRIDKIVHTEVLEEKRIHNEVVDSFDIVEYTDGLFGMYNGQKETVRIYFPNRLSSAVVDHFGQDVCMIEHDENGFVIEVEVQISNQFLAWLCGLGKGVRLLSPENVVEKVKNFLRAAYESYNAEILS